jgi:transketolase
MIGRGFREPIDDATVAELAESARRARGAVLTMTSLADSGHPGGSFSSMELLQVLYHFANIRPTDPLWPERDRIVVSHGHISPGVYSALATVGFFAMDDVVAHFRQAGGPFEGHVERHVPGAEWSTGNLGQGLSAGVGLAFGSRFTRTPWHTFVAMSDAEQNKGQVAEARRLAAKYALHELTVVIDTNDAQISGPAHEVMPVHIVEDWRADGWEVLEVDGHDVRELYAAFSAAQAFADKPVVIVARTHIGHGVSFMEDRYEFHGKALTPEQYVRAMAELGLEPELERYAAMRAEPTEGLPRVALDTPRLDVNAGGARSYGPDEKTDNRSAWGNALMDLAAANDGLPLAVFDCDLAESVKTEAFAKAYPDAFIEAGVAEHNVAAASGALSTTPTLTFWADFGVFGIDEVYNQQRLNDINRANLKLVVTHCGLDVGEDGKTHQCLDYVGAFRDFFGWKVVVPADPNQTDRAVRWAAAEAGNVCVAMGRSKLATIADADGTPVFGEGYEFAYGAVEWVREAELADIVILVMGTVAGNAVAAADTLIAEGFAVTVGVVACPLELEHFAMERACDAPLLVTVEDHSPRSGLAASVAAWMVANARATRLLHLGVTEFQSSGAAADLFRITGLDRGGIAAQIRAAADEDA